MGVSAFVHRARFRPGACSVSLARPSDRPANTSFIRRVDARPARWQVGRLVDPGWDAPGSPVAPFLSAAPIRRAFYVGRVGEVDGGIDAVLWERPSGRCTRVWIMREEVVEGWETAHPGDRVHVWAWEERHPDGIVPRRVATLHHPELTGEVRARLASILAERDRLG